MRPQSSLSLMSMISVVGLLALTSVLSVANHASAEEVCPLPAGEAPAADPRVTAQQVTDGSASLKDFALAVRDRYKTLAQELKTVEGVAYHGCIVRQEGSPYRSGSNYVVLLTPDGRVFVHAKAMAFSGRQLNPLIYAEILAALGVPIADLAKLGSTDPATVAQGSAALLSTLLQEPEGAFDASSPIPGLRPAMPGAVGHAAVYLSANFQTPIVLLAGFDLDESHVTQEVVNIGDPAITAKEVVDRETLKTFVGEAGKMYLEYLQGGDFAAASKARIALRDPNGPWRHGSVYLYVLDRTSNVIVFHGASPDRYELRPLVATVRDVVTGKLVLPQVIAAATSSPEGGFVEYYFDDPSDDSDSADIPKVGYAREFTGSIQRADGTVIPVNMIVGSGFYQSSSNGGTVPEPGPDVSACPLPPDETPPADPRVTAQQVADGSASLKDFALAVRDRYKTLAQELKTVEGVAYHGCIVRQEGSPYRSGSNYVVLLTPDGRVFVHAKAMAFSGRQLNPLIYAEILAALGVPIADLAKLGSTDPATVAQGSAALLSTLLQEPEGAFDASSPIPGLRPAMPGAVGHAAVYLSANFQTPIVLLAGFDLDESHVTQEVVNIGDPAITAKEVVDRETLKTFVGEAGKMYLEYLQGGDFAAASKARIALRDPNGPWRHGSVYLYVLDRTSNVIVFHGASPDRYELRPLVATVRDVVTGKLVLPQVIAAATSSPEGGFVEYYFDDPSDDSDSADIPKVGYAREFTGSIQRADGTVIPVNMIVGSGFYRRPTDGGGPGPGSGVVTISRGCGQQSIAASAVKTREDVRAFVECAEEYFYEHGPDEARRAFNEDERWHDGPTYVFVDKLSPSGVTSTSLVYPPDPSREGKPWGGALEAFGTDPFAETYRILDLLGSGWTYGHFEHPETGALLPKATYVTEVDWKGERAMLGAGIYESGLPSTCDSSQVSAAALEADPSPEALRAFVRCAAMLVESEGYFAKEALQTDPQWSAGASYVFVMDTMGNQVITGNGVRINGNAPHEWGGTGTPTDQFGGRDVAGVGDTFGEAFIYYRALNPSAGMVQPKAGMLKRVVSRGLPVLVGSGYYMDPEHMPVQTSCAENTVRASAISNRGQIQAFVECAAEYVRQHGTVEARRAFNEDERWKLGQIYVFVDAIAESGEDSLTYVFPPDPSREGSVWGTSIDSFGTDYYFEVHRLMSLVDSAWTYYAFTNPASGVVQPKASYVKEIDWGGNRAAIGAGLYELDLPGTCDAREVNAEILRQNPDEQRLARFVRCAAQKVAAKGYFAGPILASDPRWNHDSIETVVIDAATGQVKFGEDSGLSMGIPTAFGGRDIVALAESFGEIYAYSNSPNRVTGHVEPKVWFFKLVMTQQGQVLVASGFFPTSVVLRG